MCSNWEWKTVKSLNKISKGNVLRVNLNPSKLIKPKYNKIALSPDLFPLVACSVSSAETFASGSSSPPICCSATSHKMNAGSTNLTVTPSLYTTASDISSPEEPSNTVVQLPSFETCSPYPYSFSDRAISDETNVITKNNLLNNMNCLENNTDKETNIVTDKALDIIDQTHNSNLTQ